MPQRHGSFIHEKPNITTVLHLSTPQVRRNNFFCSKWFESSGISSLRCVIVRVSVVLKRSGVGDERFDSLSGSHLQSQLSMRYSLMVLGCFVWVRQESDKSIGFLKWTELWKAMPFAPFPCQNWQWRWRPKSRGGTSDFQLPTSDFRLQTFNF